MATNPALSRLQDIPGIRQIGLIVALAAAIAVGLWLFFWTQKPAMTPVYAGLDDKDSAEVADALRTSGIPMQIDSATGAIVVPEAQLHEARMKLAALGLPEGGRQGIEMIEGEQGFGVSQFVEGARYQHALETELTRTITALKPVKDARVHLAIPKPSAFTRQRELASASVMVTLHPGRMLDPDQVAAIVHLVAGSIPELPPERVTVVDQAGRMLTNSDPNSPSAVAAQQFEQTRRLETSFVQRVQELLEPLAGPGRVSAQVAVDMDFATIEEARESYTPDPAKIRSEQTSETTSGSSQAANGVAGTPGGAAGVPGSTSNQPPAEQADVPVNATASNANAQNSSKSATRNFELDRTVSHTKQPSGRVKRVSVAVLVDHLPQPPDEDGVVAYKPLDDATLKQVEALVKEAVGYNAERGDTVSVMNAPFARAPEGEAADGQPFYENPALRDLARLGLGALAVLVLLLGVVRPLIKNLMGPQKVDVQSVPPEMLAAAAAAGGAAAPQVPVNIYDEKLKLAKTAATSDAKRVAQVMKTWVGNDG